MREQRTIERNGHDHMPALNLDLKPKGRGPSVRRAKDRYRDRTGAEEREAGEVRREEAREEPKEQISLQHALEEALHREEPWPKEIDLAGDFARAAGDSGGKEEASGGDSSKTQVRISRAERRSERQRGRGRDDDFERER